MTFQMRWREPLMDGHWRRTINRRSKEGLGLLLLISGAAMGMAVASYSASDPGMLTATENRPQKSSGARWSGCSQPVHDHVR